MKPRDIEKIIRADGWHCTATKGSHKHYEHKTKPGKVTIPFHGSKELKKNTVASILRQAGLD